MAKYTDAKRDANRRWDEKNRDRYWRATIVFPAEEKPSVVARAEQTGQSLSDYIRGLIAADMAREEQGN